MNREIIEILKDAELTNDLQNLINLWNEIANNKRSYPLTEIWTARDRIAELALKANAQDIDKGKFVMFLDSQKYNSESFTNQELIKQTP